MESLAGQLLLASPQLLDPNFARAVVFLIQHNQDGALGVVLNRPLRKTVQELWREVGSTPCNNHHPIYMGGPVPGPLMSLHTRQTLAETEPASGVFFAAKKDHLDKLVMTDEPGCKIFLGHAGWGSGQLENELQQGAWRTLDATAELVLSTDDTLWERLLKQLGHSLLKSILGIETLPPDPTVN